jgi:hypothetical protein
LEAGLRRALSLIVLLMLVSLAGCSGFFISTHSSIVLTSSATNATAGASITLTGTVSPTNATGTVTFYDGTTSLGTGTLSSGVATLAVTSLAAGSHSVTAVYGGDSSHDESGSAAVAVTITAAASSTSTSLSVNADDSGKTTLVATVSPTNSAGVVQFYDGNVLIGSANVVMGKATLATNALAGGPASLTASYAGEESHPASWSDVVNVPASR